MSEEFAYSVRVKNGAAWRQFSCVRLMISVGQHYHEGEKLRAVVEWINRNPCIQKVHVSVNDYLQRHNLYAQGIPPEQADAISLLDGTLWLERNEDILSDIHCTWMTTRWQEWFGTSQYQVVRDALDIYRSTEQGFVDAIKADASLHVTRRLNRGEAIPPAFLSHSENYLQEELAVFALQTQQLPAAEVYPGSNLQSATYLLGKTLPPNIAPLADRYFTRIDFSRINQRSSAA